MIAGLNELWGYLWSCAWRITVDLSLPSVNIVWQNPLQKKERVAGESQSGEEGGIEAG